MILNVSKMNHLSIFNHSMKVVFTVFQPGGKGFRISNETILKSILAKADHVEVPLDEVDNHLLVGHLLVLCCYIILPLKEMES